MSGNYQIYFNYDNDKQVYCIPVNPEQIQVTYKGITTSASIDKFGEVLHKGKRNAAVITFESFFPPRYDKILCSCTRGQFKSPWTWAKWLMRLEEKNKPCHFVVTGSPLSINMYADVTNFVPKEVGGDPGTIQYSVELKESRTPEVSRYMNKTKTSGKKDTGKRPSNKENPKTYTVKAGDTLWNLAKKFYGNGSDYTVIYKANKDRIKNKNKLKTGTVLTIPEQGGSK